MDEKERLHDENIKKAAGGGAWNDNRYNAVYGIDESLCIACQMCITVCPLGCITYTPFAKIDDSVCIRCGSCSGICPSSAIGWWLEPQETEEEN